MIKTQNTSPTFMAKTLKKIAYKNADLISAVKRENRL